MFDIGVSELAVIGIVAMIVIGPEELPRVARTAGHLLGRLRRYVSDVKSDISREMELAELKRMQEQVQTSAQEVKSAINEQMHAATRDFQHPIAPASTVSNSSASSSDPTV
ncbi:MAG TPA: Sec-independent protein translocase protein TatB, partial [Rhodocyclaceae bacterium]|nr:Sec-independent protein translocase protein TatB [Rhodocyclaceae bacterium]